MKMNVLKFGGTSVGSAQNIRKVVEILSVTEKPKIVVLSAMSGVTNLLVSLNQASIDKDSAQITNVLEQLQAKHFEAIEDLFTAENQPETKAQIETFVAALKEIATGGRTLTTYAELVTYGETMLTWMFSKFLDGYDVVCASRFMKGGEFKNAPIIKSILVKIVSLAVSNFTKLQTKDPTNGFRLFSNNFIKKGQNKFNPADTAH